MSGDERELFASEQPYLIALPDWIPPVYRIHQRIVGIEGYIHLDTNLYSVPLPVGRQVEVRETKDRIEVYDGPRVVATHDRVEEAVGRRVTDPAHRPRRGEGRKARMAQEEAAILMLAPELSEYVEGLKNSSRGVHAIQLRRLLSMVRDYPRGPLVSAIREALTYRLFDLERVERMVLRRIGESFFFLNGDGVDDDQER